MIAMGVFRIAGRGRTGPVPSTPVQAASQQGCRRRHAAVVAAGLRVRRRRAHGYGGHRDGCARVPAPRVAQRGADADRDGGMLAHAVHGRHVPGHGFTWCRSPHQTVIAQVAGHVYGDRSVGFFLFQAFTALLLFLAANTSFNAFPRLPAILADDGFIPASSRSAATAWRSRRDHACWRRGGQLVVAFGGETHAADPAVRRRRVHRLHHQPVGHGPALAAGHEPRAGAPALAINAIGALLTGIVAVVVTSAKARRSPGSSGPDPDPGAIMLFIRRQYDGQAEELASATTSSSAGPSATQRVVIPVNGINRSVVQAVSSGAGARPSMLQASS